MRTMRQRVLEALAEDDGVAVAELLTSATQRSAVELTPLVGRLLVHRHWRVRAGAVGLVGTFHLLPFALHVKCRLSDTNPTVRIRALDAYYDLLGAKALPLIERLLHARDTRVRTAALVIYYVETRHEVALWQLAKLLTTKRSSILNHEIAWGRFQRCLDLPAHPRALAEHPHVLDLFQRMLAHLPPRCGVAREIRSVLRAQAETERRDSAGPATARQPETPANQVQIGDGHYLDFV